LVGQAKLVPKSLHELVGPDFDPHPISIVIFPSCLGISERLPVPSMWIE
jgi:hypothetical protein